MGMAVGGSQGGPKSDINVTPLVDVVLVLLIIFMVVTPMLQRGKSVTLPKAAKVEDEKPGNDPDPLILSMTADKKTFVEQDEFDAAGLEAKLRETLAYLPNKKLLLKGDSSLTVGDVRQVMEITRKAKARKIFLGVEEQK
ncbi:MAG TPA: biopolymer transporter ExbD [Archangium sp.]|jgi:biopolymer transport protein ExbD/biopolymer transport protein TolR|uniref:ExbD/TolR family protein n=1 Tax=Archangium sp. TaxID=1872627 RepID=UPI002ED9142B